MQSTINQRRSDLGAVADRVIHLRVNLMLALIVATVAIILAIVVPMSGGQAVTLEGSAAASDRAAQAEFESWLARAVEVERTAISSTRLEEVNALGREQQFLASFAETVYFDDAWAPASDVSLQEQLSYLVHTE